MPGKQDGFWILSEQVSGPLFVVPVIDNLLEGISAIYGFYGGGYTGSDSNVIDYIDMTLTSGNAIDRGDLTVARNALAGVSG